MDQGTRRITAALADRYRIERHLGEGGMATVYLAEDLKHHRKVAVKVLRPELAAVLGAERFIQEIATTASLQHPHILPLFDSGRTGAQDDGPGGAGSEFLYYVMPYVEGETLRDRLNRETQLGVDEAVRIATEVADALDYAHRHGVIHRDIKPENILLHDGHTTVADFGIALAVSAAAGGRMTETGLSLGTPHYMSPEQATAEKDLTSRSDIYSLGSVLYEMLAGEPPHTGGSAQQIIMKIVTDAPRPLTQLRRSVPPNVAAAVATSLEKLAADRFDTARAFADALGNVAFTTAGDDAILRAPSGTARPDAGWKLTAGALGLALVAGTAGWWLRPIPDLPARPVTFAVEPSTGSIHWATPALAPDGSVLVFAADTMLYQRRLGDLSALPIPGTEGAHQPFFSPDGVHIGFEAHGTLRRIALNGGTVRTITEFSGYLAGATWGGDGNTIVFTTWAPPGVYRVNAEGGVPEVVTGVSEIADSVILASPSFVTNDAVLFSTAEVEPRIVLASLTSPEVRWLSAGTAPSYVRSGALVYVDVRGTVLAQPFDAARLDTTGPGRPVLEGVGRDWVGAAIDASPSGALAFVPDGLNARRLVLASRDGTKEVLLDDQAFWSPRFSPDGSRIAFGTIGALEDVWVHEFASRTTRRVTIDGQVNNDPVWSPDGGRVAFSRLPSKDLHLATVDGGGVEEVLVQDGLQWTSDWSPDGRFLVYTDAAESQDIWVAPLDGDDAPYAFVNTPFQERGGRVSPNGRWLAYESNESGRFEVHVESFPLPGRKAVVSASGGLAPVWASDGQELFYLTPQGQLIAQRVDITGETLTFGRADPILEFPEYVAGPHGNYDIHPDGDRFVVVEYGGQNVRIVVALDLLDP